MRAAILGMLALFMLAGTAGCGQGGGSSEASCTAPVLTSTGKVKFPLPHTTASPGQTVRVYGYGYVTCHDTNVQPASRPFSHLEVLVVQGKNRFPVTTVSARQDGTFQVSIRLPAGLHPGTATIRTSQEGEVPLTVQVAGLAKRG